MIFDINFDTDFDTYFENISIFLNNENNVSPQSNLDMTSRLLLTDLEKFILTPEFINIRNSKIDGTILDMGNFGNLYMRVNDDSNMTRL